MLVEEVAKNDVRKKSRTRKSDKARKGEPPGYEERERMPSDALNQAGMKVPRWREIMNEYDLVPGGGGSKEDHALHISSQVGPGFNIEKLLELTMMTEDRRKLVAVLGWTNDDRGYQAVKFDGKFFKVDMCEKHLAQMVQPEYFKCELVTPEMEMEHPTGGACQVFTTTELKQLKEAIDGVKDFYLRERIIGWTRTINDAVEQAEGVQFHTKEELHAPLKGGNMYAIQLDMMAWFDQIPLDPARRRFYRFKAGGKLYQFLKTPMGARQSVEIAQYVVKALVSGTHPESVWAHIHVDNVRFMGRSKEEVIQSASNFIKRCIEVGAIINETMDPNPESLALLVEEEGDFLGESYDYKEGKVRVAEKTMKKIAYSWENRENWSMKQMAAHYSLLFYSGQTLGIRPTEYFGAMRHYRDTARILQQNPYLWTCPAMRLAPAQLNELAAWTELIRKNEWRTITDEEPITKWIVTDASAWGWGAMCWNGTTLEIHGQEWEQEFKEAHGNFSAHAEPEAIIRSLCKFVRPGERAKIFTDHEALKWAGPKGYSSSYTVNDILRRIKQNFGDQVVIVYLPGHLNPADPMSRNRAPDKNDEDNQFAWMAAVKVEENVRAAESGHFYRTGG